MTVVINRWRNGTTLCPFQLRTAQTVENTRISHSCSSQVEASDSRRQSHDSNDLGSGRHFLARKLRHQVLPELASLITCNCSKSRRTNSFNDSAGAGLDLTDGMSKGMKPVKLLTKIPSDKVMKPNLSGRLSLLPKGSAPGIDHAGPTRRHP